jgi:Zn-finger nucleic acid-binding protein
MTTNSYILVPVADVSLRCVKADADVWVDFVPLCDALGLDEFEQAAMLAHPRYRGQFRFREQMEAAGRPYFVRHIHANDVPTWLNKLDLRRFPAEVARRLQLVQEQCADAIRRHFFGGAARADHAPAQVGDELELIIRTATAMRELARRTDQVEQRVRGSEETAHAALRHVALRREDYFEVRACLALWRQDDGLANSTLFGRLVKDEAVARGLGHIKDNDLSGRWGTVNAWPPEYILAYFAARFGPCPNGKIRDLLRSLKQAGKLLVPVPDDCI